MLALILAWFIFAMLGSWIALQKARSGAEGFVLGLLFGPFGALIEALLPSISLEERARMEEAERHRELDAKRKWVEERRRAKEIAEKSKAIRAERARRQREFRKKLWQSTPEWARMTIFGLILGFSLCSPVVVYCLLPSSGSPQTREETIPAPRPPIKGDEAQADAELERDKQHRREESRSRILARIPPLAKPVEEDRPLDEVDLKAREYERAGDFENAAICYRVLIEENPDTPQAKRAVEKLKKWGKPIDVEDKAKAWGGSGGGLGRGIGPGTEFFGAREHGHSFAYVIDCSGSMGLRNSLEVAKRELLASLNQLPPDARFSVIWFFRFKVRGLGFLTVLS